MLIPRSAIPRIRTVLVRLDAGETQLKRLPDRDGGGCFDEGLRAILTKSLEKQWEEMAARWLLEAIDCEVCDPGGIAFRFVVAVHHDLYLNAFLAGVVDFVFSHVSWRQIPCRRRFLA